MNWSVKYATTKKSIREINNAMPEGWSVTNFGQPGDKTWLPREQEELRKGRLWDSRTKGIQSFSKPDIIKVSNIQTNNSILLYDHGALQDGGDNLMRQYWNVNRHAKYINAMAKHLDALHSVRGRGEPNGVMLNLARSGDPYMYNNEVSNAVVHQNYSDDSSVMNNVIHLNSPDLIHKINFHSNKYNPHMIASLFSTRSGKSSEKINATLTHEYGHLVHSDALDENKYFKKLKDALKSTGAKMPHSPRKIIYDTSATEYGYNSDPYGFAVDAGEHYAEHFAAYKHGITSHNPKVTNYLAKSLQWGEPLSKNDKGNPFNNGKAMNYKYNL